MYTYDPTHYPSFMGKEVTHDIYNGDEYIASAQSESTAHTIVNALNLAEQISTTYIKAPTSKLPDRIMSIVDLFFIDTHLNPEEEVRRSEEIEEAVPPQPDTFTSECTRCGTLLDIEDMRIFCKNCW